MGQPVQRVGLCSAVEATPLEPKTGLSGAPVPPKLGYIAPKNKNAGLVGPATSLSLICGERLVTSWSPRISLKLFGSAPLRTAKYALLLDQSQTFQLFFQNRQRTT